MEAFSLLKYWRTSGGSGGSVITADTTVVHPRAATKTIFTSTSAESPDSSDGEDGPYFDLEFAALPEDESDNEEESSEKTEENYQISPKTANGNETESGNGGKEMSEEKEEGEANITLTSDENHELTISPSEELLFEGSLVSVEPTGIILNDSEENSKFPVFLLKSATKFRVLFLKLKKTKSVNGILEKAEKMEANGHENSSPQKFQVKQSTLSDKFFTVMCKAEEVRIPLVSLFTRDNSSKGKHDEKCTKNNQEDSDSTSASEERKLTKEVVQKYIKMVKPLYVRVSKRYVEKLNISGPLNFSAGATSKRGGAVSLPAEKGGETTKTESSAVSVNTHPKQASINNNLQAGLKVVRKHLGKSRSASAIVTPPPGKMASSRRDDSLLQIHDGIQGAILHCKKSFHATKDVESSVISRSVCDPRYEKSVIMSTDSSSSTSSSSFSEEETKDKLE